MENITKDIVNEIKKGYITGFFDAEGYVGIDNNYNLAVFINQTHKTVLERLDSEFRTPSGLKDHCKENYDEKGVHRKEAWRWKLNSNNAVPFLEYVYPNSMEKRSQIELALKYQKETKTDSRKSGISQSEIEQRKWFKNKLEELKNETHDDQTLKNYDNEIKLMKIPKDIRDGRQLLLMSLEELYKYNDIDINEIKSNKINQIKSRHVLKMSEHIEIGYLSGFFDGEGYVGLSKSENGYYKLYVSISNCNFNILKMYEAKFGGKICLSQKQKEYYKDKYQWYIINNNTLSFLKTIRNYTIVKKSQIDTTIEFQEWHNLIGSIKTSDQKQKVERYYNILRELKKETGETTNETISNCKLVKQQSKSLADYD